ncbi:MAG: acyl-CoA dehydrogenase family protein [Acidimicrobiales bacterium]|nr:acyl-CoA dehydrogenase family protein [Acidimicrobiales bacterium]
MSIDFCELATRYVPELRTRGTEIDAHRALPQDLADRLATDGFYRLCTPTELGGAGASPQVLAEVCEILATGNGSTAWCVFIGATSQYMFPAVSTRLLQEMLENPNVITSGVFAYSGTATRLSDAPSPKWRIDGRWDWGSGCHNAEWISGGVVLCNQDGEPIPDRHQRPTEARAFFRPEEITILDNWHTSGLRGSGSNSYVVQDLDLSDYRIATVEALRGSPLADLPVYRFPRFGYLALPIGAIALGMARDSIDEALGVAKGKTPTGSSRTLAGRPAFHRQVATADASLRAARLAFYAAIQDAWHEAHQQIGTLETRRLLRTSTVHAVTTSIEVIDLMYTTVGGTSVFEESPLQRHFRDVHVASQHMMVAEPVMELAGRVMSAIDDTALGL